MQLPKDRPIDLKRYGLYTCGVLCGYLMIFIVGPFFFFMSVILVITGALFGLEQILSAGWIFMIIGIIIFILGLIIPRVFGALLSRMIVKDVTDIVKENEPVINEVAAAWTEGVNNGLRLQSNLRQRQLQFPGHSPHFGQSNDIFGGNLAAMQNGLGTNEYDMDEWVREALVRGSSSSAPRGRGGEFPQPPPYPGEHHEEPTQPPPYPTAAAV